MFEILYERPLPAKYRLLYRDIAFDGLHYYLTLTGENKIARLSLDWQLENVFSTERRYTCLCYDTREDCFWAASGNAYSVIFRLDRSFAETGHFSLNPFEGYLTALSYCVADDAIAIAVGGHLLTYNKTPKKKLNKIRQCGALLMGVGAICPYYLCCELKHSQQTLSVVTRTGSFLKEFTLPSQYVMRSVLSAKEDREHYHLKLLTNKQGQSYILEVRLAKCDLASSDYRPTGTRPAVTLPECPRSPDCPPASVCPQPERPRSPECPPASVCPQPECPRSPECPPASVCPQPECPRSPECPPHCVCPPLQPYIPYPIYIPLPQQSTDCPYLFPCCHPVTPPAPSCGTKEPCFNEIFHSIAHVNCLIARILQAEGEKLEHAAPGLDQVDQLLALNESATRMITSVTHLEQTFYAMLDTMLRESRAIAPKSTQVSANKAETDTPQQ